MSKKVFLSFSSKDFNIVENFVKMLEKQNITYWKAPEMIPVGSSYAKEIPVNIMECEFFLLLLSDNSMESIWVEKELDFAINKKKKIIPVCISKTIPTDTFLFYLNNIQMINYYSDREKAIELLLSILMSKSQDTCSNNKSSNTCTQNKDLNTFAHNKSTNTFTHNKLSNSFTHSRLHDYKHSHKVHRSLYGDPSFGLNPQPQKCSYCGGNLKMLAIGIYKCVDCDKENYDYFHKVKNYLDEKGPSTRLEIESETGVPTASIDYFFMQEKLEIPKASSQRVQCKICGRLIRTGIYCDYCKTKLAYNR